MECKRKKKNSSSKIIDLIDTPISTYMILFSASNTALRAEAEVLVGETGLKE